MADAPAYCLTSSTGLFPVLRLSLVRQFKMAANKRKFMVPSVDDLDERNEVSKPKSLFNVYKKSTGSVQETTDDSFPRAGRANDLDNTESSLKTIQKEVSLVESRKENDLGQRTVEDNCMLNHESLVKEALRPAENSLPSANDSGTLKPAVVGKTFRETFAFLDNTSHYKETVAKIKEKEYVITGLFTYHNLAKLQFQYLVTSPPSHLTTNEITTKKYI